MRATIILVGALVFAVSLCALEVQAETPAHFWSQRFGSTDNEEGFSIAVDGAGNVFVTGAFRGTVDFGGGPLVSAGLDDVFLAKYDANGAHLWSQRRGGTGNDLAFSIAASAGGDLLVTGFFNGTANFGGLDLVSAGFDDIFLAKYNTNGTPYWSQGFGGTGIDNGLSVALDALGNVFVTGQFQETVDFGGGAIVSAGFYDVFLAKYDASGVHQWSDRFGSAAFDWDAGQGVATDGSGNVFLTGRFEGSVNFGGGALVSAGQSDIVIAKYSSFGIHQWSQRFGSTGGDIGNSVAVDASGNVIATGYFDGTVDFGGGGLAAADGPDMFVAKYNAGGVHQWSRNAGGSDINDLCLGEAVAVDAAGEVVVTGSFRGSADFGAGTVVGAGSQDIFLVKYDTAGVHRWSQGFGNTGTDEGLGVAVDGWGNGLVTGYFRFSVNLGGGPLVSAGIYDVFVAKYAGDPQEPAITSISDIGNDQGRQVKIRFDRSGFDTATSPTSVLQYEAYRRDDPPPAGSISSGGLNSGHELLADGWTQVGTVAAHEEGSYGIDVPTIGDSTIALGQYRSVFYVRAATASPGTYFDSAPDSGYSLDNLAPGVPGNFAYAAGLLSWEESTAEDFDYFTVYGSNSSSFGSATAIDYSVAPMMDVSASPYVFYFVTATDFSGNEGTPATVNTLSGAGDTPKEYALTISSYPNPFNPATTIRYTVPSKGRVTIEIYDTRGARVATIVDDDRDAGSYTERWDGRDGVGRVATSGVYFARVMHPAGTRSYKMVLLK